MCTREERYFKILIIQFSEIRFLYFPIKDKNLILFIYMFNYFFMEIILYSMNALNQIENMIILIINVIIKLQMKSNGIH